MDKQKLFNYRVYGLNVQSEIECPEIPLSYDGIPDVKVKIGKVPDRLTDSLDYSDIFEARGDCILLKTNSIADVLVSNGNSIVIQPKEGARLKEIRLFLLGRVIGAVILQRELLPLHGSAIVLDGEAIIFCGDSGVGKSTIVRLLIDRGYPFLDDNISAISINQARVPIINPGYSQIKLWKDVLSLVEENPEVDCCIQPLINKYTFDFKNLFYNEPVPVRKIYTISPGTFENIEFFPLSGLNKLAALTSCTFGVHFLKGLGKEKMHFRFINLLGSKISVCNIRRPEKSDPNKLVDLIEKDFLNK